jgi:hypothetical protein
VFPILYIDVPALEDSARRKNDPVLSLIAKRQYVDWREFRYLDINSTEVKREVGRFCTHIRDALQKPWVSPQERKAQEEAVARRQADAERQRQEAEAKRRADEEARQRTAEQQRREREAEAEQRRVERRRDEKQQREREQAAMQGRAGQEERRGTLPSQRVWRKSRLALIIGSLAGVVVLGAIGAWLASTSIPTPVEPPPSTKTPPLVEPPPGTKTPTPPAPRTAGTPLIPGLNVGFGDTVDQVQSAYNIHDDPKQQCDPLDPCLQLKWDGLLFQFKYTDKSLSSVSAEAPFSGSIAGVRIGDALDSVVTRLGQPTDKYQWMNAYTFRPVGGGVLNLTVNEKDKKVVSIRIYRGK